MNYQKEYFYSKKKNSLPVEQVVSFSTKTTIWFYFNKHPTGAVGCLVSYNLKIIILNFNYC